MALRNVPALQTYWHMNHQQLSFHSNNLHFYKAIKIISKWNNGKTVDFFSQHNLKMQPECLQRWNLMRKIEMDAPMKGWHLLLQMNNQRCLIDYVCVSVSQWIKVHEKCLCVYAVKLSATICEDLLRQSVQLLRKWQFLVTKIIYSESATFIIIMII